jgi:hypothetical protein
MAINPLLNLSLGVLRARRGRLFARPTQAPVGGRLNLDEILARGGLL